MESITQGGTHAAATPAEMQPMKASVIIGAAAGHQRAATRPFATSRIAKNSALMGVYPMTTRQHHASGSSNKLGQRGGSDIWMQGGSGIGTFSVSGGSDGASQ